MNQEMSPQAVWAAAVGPLVECGSAHAPLWCCWFEQGRDNGPRGEVRPLSAYRAPSDSGCLGGLLLVCAVPYI